MTHPVTVIPGDGIGPEVIAAARTVLDATGVGIEWEEEQVRAGEPRDAALDALRRTRVGLKGPVTTPPGVPSPNIALRRELDLYVQVRVARGLGGRAIDVAVIRETTEDLYAGLEIPAGAARELLESLGADVDPGAAVSLKPVSEGAARRAAAFACAWARDHGRRRVTIVHKAAVMRATDGLFLEVARDVGAGFPEVEVDDGAVDAVAARLATQPEELDVLFTTNLYGDVLADLAAALAGGVGIAPGANYGNEIALFEATHGSAPKHAGANRVNPIAAILSGAMLLQHLGEKSAAGRVESAVAAVVREGRVVTYDLGGDATTTDVAGAVAARLS